MENIPQKAYGPIRVQIIGEPNVGKTFFIYHFFLGISDDIQAYDLKLAPNKIHIAYPTLSAINDNFITDEEKQKLSEVDLEIEEISTISDIDNLPKPDVAFIIFDAESEESWEGAKAIVEKVQIEDTKMILVGNNKSQIERKALKASRVTNELNGWKIKYSNFKGKEKGECVKHFDEMIRKSYHYLFRMCRILLDKKYRIFVKYSKEGSILTKRSYYIEKFMQFLTMPREELKAAFDLNENNSFDPDSVKDETLLIIQSLFEKAHSDNYTLVKEKCDKCGIEVTSDNRIMLTNCLHCYCKEDMIKFCQMATKGQMDLASYETATDNLNCCEICKNVSLKLVKVKFSDAYKCGAMKYKKPDYIEEVKEEEKKEGYENGKTEEEISADIHEFFCMLCRKRVESEEFQLFFCCNKSFCSGCMSRKIKIEYLRALEDNEQFHCPCGKRMFPVDDIKGYYGRNLEK